jgi:tetratricopeptide (TPR) repeat protein
MKSLYSLLIIHLLTFSLCYAQTGQKEGGPLFSGLGNYNHSIETKSQLAQRYFNQGLVLMYGFDYAEAIRSFQAAIIQDPECAMCYWGLAMALGSKSNTPLNGHEREDALSALQKAQQYVNPHNPHEKAYIDALSHRYSDHDVQAHRVENFSCSVSSPNVNNDEAKSYADAMKNVANSFSKDPDAKILYAAALADSAGWNFYNQERKPTPETVEIIKTLQEVMAAEPNNPFAHHYYIHVLEPSNEPERAMKSADFLRDAIPGAEHIVHMPSHIYILTGRYQDAVVSNQKAIEAFARADKEARDQGYEPSVNYLYQHDLHFLFTVASMQGQSKIAMEAARAIAAATPYYLAKQDNLQIFLAMPLFAEVRFGLWNDILKERHSVSDFHFLQGIWYYARGMAYANLDQIVEAKIALSRLREIANEGPTEQNMWEGGVEQLKIAIAVLAATIADKTNQNDQMLTNWQRAVNLQDAIGYQEPPFWYFPTREGLGAALLKLNKPQEAEVVYRQLLKQYPKYAWALYGLSKSLKVQGKDTSDVDAQFKEAWKYADIAKPEY